MKKILKYTATILSAFLIVSCSLEEGNDNFPVPSEFYSSLGECKAGVRGCYHPLRAIYAKDMMMAVESVTDLMNASGCATQDALLEISPATARFGVTMWKQAYIGVRNTNMCIEGLETTPVDSAKVAPLLAEAKTLRAFYYYLLTSLFGDVPYYTDVIKDRKDLERIEKLPRMDAYETRAKLVYELQGCIAAFPEGRPYDLNTQHIGAAFCHMLIAKMAMWNKDWNTAEAALLKLRSNEFFGEYTRDRYPIEDNCFSAKNTPESIFEVQHTYTEGGLNVTTNLACYMMPHRGNGETDIYDGVQIPELGKLATTYVGLRPNKYFYQNLMPKDSKDLRKSINLAWDYKGKAFKASKPWLGPKFWCWDMNKTYDSNNYPVFRYGDAVLMLAEVYNEQDGRMGEAIACLNEVRTRAGLDPIEGLASSKEALLEEIQRERGRELLGEFQRKFDLVRWGVWYNQTYNNTDFATVRANILHCHEYYPIPDEEVALSDNNLDNDAYKAELTTF